jgi:hypothetical protein
MEEQPTLNGDNRNPDGTFAVGNTGGPGRPTGSVSIVAKIKAKFEEDPKYFEEWISKLLEDPSNRKAVMESFFSSLETERTARKMYRTRDDAKAGVFDYIERFYNPKRRHSTIGYLSPMEFERQAGLA